MFPFKVKGAWFLFSSVLKDDNMVEDPIAAEPTSIFLIALRLFCFDIGTKI
jgi:hypothetical protein